MMRKEDLLTEKYRQPPEGFWNHERMLGGDGYDVMERAMKDGRWVAIPSWGRDGWDLGSWPLVVIYCRKDHAAGEYEIAYYVEGDVTVYRYATFEERNRAIDALAFFHWSSNGDSWTAGVETADDMPPHLCGPFSWKRTGRETVT